MIQNDLHEQQELHRSRLAVVAFTLGIPVLILGSIAVVWFQDAGPVPNEFTEADYIQVRPENEASWDLLLQLNDKSDDPNGAPAIGLSKQDLELLEALWEEASESETVSACFEIVTTHSKEIKSLWDKSSNGRLILKELGQYDEIADYAKPHIDAVIPYCLDVKLLLKINLLHSLLLLEKGDDIEACKEVIAYDSIFRKHSCSARSLISKLICYGVFEKTFYATSLMVNHTNTSRESLLLLRSHFNSLTEEQLSLRNSFIHEYLLFKNSNDSYLNLRGNPLYKVNSILRYYDSVCRNSIRIEQGKLPNKYSPISVWAWEKPNWPKVSLDVNDICENYYDLYFFYNPIGAMQMKIMLPALGSICKIKEKIYIEDDLFQWVLARRMGQEGSLKARAYSDEYTVDVDKGLVFSVGPDGQPYTDDDIKLRINPEVLGLKQINSDPTESAIQ